MKVIFLDIDGVLNNKASFKKKYDYFQKYKVHISNIDHETVKRLSKIVGMTDAKIVLSSSWRSDWANGSENITLTPSKQVQELFDEYAIEVIGITPTLPKTNKVDEIYTSWRENEIKYYLKQHPEIEHFCVIDDEIFDLYSLKEYLVKTKNEFGLQEHHIDEAIKILGKRYYKSLLNSNVNNYVK